MDMVEILLVLGADAVAVSEVSARASALKSVVRCSRASGEEN